MNVLNLSCSNMNLSTDATERIHLAPSSPASTSTNSFKRVSTTEIEVTGASFSSNDENNEAAFGALSPKHARSRSFFVTGVTRRQRYNSARTSLGSSWSSKSRPGSNRHWPKRSESTTTAGTASRQASINTPRRREVQLSKISIYIIIMFVICHRCAKRRVVFSTFVTSGKSFFHTSVL